MRGIAGVLLLVVGAGCRDWHENNGIMPDERPIVPEPEFRLEGRLDFPADVALPVGDVRVALVRADLRNLDVPLLDGVWAQESLGTATTGEPLDFELVLDRVPDDREFYAPDPAYPEFEVASYMVGAYVDRNGNDRPDAEDQLVGSTWDLLVRARGERPEDDDELVLEEGWNVVRLEHDTRSHDIVDNIPENRHEEDFVLSANLLPPQTEDLTGVIAPNLGGRVAIDLYSMKQIYTGARPANATLRQITADATQASAPFRFQAPLPTPPADHFFTAYEDRVFYGVEAAIALAVAYDDTNANGHFDPDSEAWYGTTLDAGGRSRLIVYLRPLDFTAIAYDEILGQAAGWMLLDATGDADKWVGWDTGVTIDSRAP